MNWVWVKECPQQQWTREKRKAQERENPSGRTEGQEFQAGLKRSFLHKKWVIMERSKDNCNFLMIYDFELSIGVY